MIISNDSFPHTKLSVPDHILFRELDGESVLLNLENEAYFGLDEVGTHFWSALTQAHNIQAGLDTLLATYEVDSAELSADVSRMLGELNKAGLVKIEHVS